MAGRTTCMVMPAAGFIIITILLAASTTAMADDSTPIPADGSQVGSWFDNNVKPLAERKGVLDAALVTAEDGPKLIKVMKDGSGNFKTLTDAINSIPERNTKRVIVYIGGGVYNEKIKIPQNKPFVTLYGSPKNMPTLMFDGTAQKYGTVYSGTLTVESDYFRAANIIVTNSAPEPDGIRSGAQAVALQISGDKAAFYNCKFIGFQDTLYDYKGLHFFKDCYIQGTVDFIFGKGKSLYLNTEIHVLERNITVVTAQQRDASEDNGFSFVHCKITGTTCVKGTYLGRAWGSSPTVVFAYTDMANVVHPERWNDFGHPERSNNMFYGEFQNSGQGSNISGQARYTKKLSDAEAKSFLSLGYIQGSKWLLPHLNTRSRHSIV
ncbi:unnamed protein product [Prunus armeniaca]